MVIGITTLLTLTTACGGSGSASAPSNQNLDPPPAPQNANVTTYHNDNYRSGVNSQESRLTPTNVNVVSFGRRAVVPVQGAIFSQPLFLSAITTGDGKSHDLVIVATEHDQVYAIDANTQAIVWHKDFLSTDGTVTTLQVSDLPYGCDSIKPEVGITGTPVIDPTTSTIYLVVRTKETQNGTALFYQRLHALDLLTGNDKLTPTEITSPPDPNGQFGVAKFDPWLNNQRSALLLANGRVYVSWASHCDTGNYQGWVMSFDASTIQMVSAWTPSPAGTMGGIWMSGSGPASDNSGDVFMAVGNGLSDAMTGGANYGNSVVRLHNANSQLAAVDYFIPFDWQTLFDEDLDLGSGGPAFFDDSENTHQHLMVVADKDGKIYLLDRDNLGHWHQSDDGEIVQAFQSDGQYSFSTPAVWNNTIYFGFVARSLEAFAFNPQSAQMSSNPTSRGTMAFNYPGATPSVSSNGTSNGIVWAVSVALYAFDATDLSKELYDSEMSPERDRAGPSVTFCVPTVANGQVFVGTQNEMDIYGELSP